MTYLTPLPLQHFKLPKARTTPQNAHTAQKRALSCTKETPLRGPLLWSIHGRTSFGFRQHMNEMPTI